MLKFVLGERPYRSIVHILLKHLKNQWRGFSRVIQVRFFGDPHKYNIIIIIASSANPQNSQELYYFGLAPLCK